MHTALQARLLEEIVQVIPQACQLWVAGHSVGMMRKAKELHRHDPESVVFLDFGEKDFDQSVTLAPVAMDRGFWKRTLNVVLDDLADLVAPTRVVLCEGRARGPESNRAGFDARCYTAIFSQEFPDTDLVSVGNEADVRTDRLQLGEANQALVSGTSVVRLVDRDAKTQDEIDDLVEGGVRVLSRRHLESYLLDDEVLIALCESLGQPEKSNEIIEAKKEAVSASVGRMNPPDDLKSAAGGIQVAARTFLTLTQGGSSAETFMRDILAPLITPTMSVYQELKNDIFVS